VEIRPEALTAKGVRRVWNIDGMTRFLAAVLAAFVLGTMAIVAAPVAIAKPHEPVQCTPVGVTKKPDGSVWAVEDCDGEKIHYRLPDK
jgi:hypothetical protein